jgi:hypothetical protein
MLIKTIPTMEKQEKWDKKWPCHLLDVQKPSGTTKLHKKNMLIFFSTQIRIYFKRSELRLQCYVNSYGWHSHSGYLTPGWLRNYSHFCCSGLRNRKSINIFIFFIKLWKLSSNMTQTSQSVYYHNCMFCDNIYYHCK